MLKLGYIDVLNVLPIYYGILSQKISLNCELVTGKVNELNQKLHQGEIDVSVISSFEYARNPQLYYLLPELSISADGPVRSIYLFLKKPIEELDGDPIVLTKFSLTSVHLIRFLLKEQNVQYIQNIEEDHSGVLLIADEAIRRYYEKKDAYVYDLANLWREKTGLPFVFAIWAARRDSFERDPEGVKEICQALIRSKDETGQQYEEMAKNYYEGVFPDKESCAWYLKNLRYDFSKKYQEGFFLFQEEMVKLGKLPEISSVEFLPNSGK